MKRARWEKNKTMIIIGIPILYIIIAGIFIAAVSAGMIARDLPKVMEVVTSDNVPEVSKKSVSYELQSAEIFFDNDFIRSNGHIVLYIAENTVNKDNNQDNNPNTDNNAVQDTTLEDNASGNSEDSSTNSEAASYYLLWKAKEKDRKGFDKEVEFIKDNMIQPRYGYLMWRLNSSDKASGDGSNIATDADLRAIKALLIAEKQWKDENDSQNYTQLIDEIASGIEKVAITKDGYLAPYGGALGDNSTWTADEVWLSYSDFTVFRELAARRGAPWNGIYERMKNADLKAQLVNGLYNSMLTGNRQYGNGIDAGGYSINSMWMMVRNAESQDPELMQSANKSLQFYKDKFSMDTEIYAQYSSNGDPLNSADTPWVYALVGRAAIALDDKDFSESMIQKLVDKQISDNSSRYFGAFPEGNMGEVRVGQFTMQESILSMQDFDEMN